VIAAGAQVNGIDFRLHKAPAFHIRGKVLDGRSGEPLSKVNVHLQTRGNLFFENARVRANGTFDVPGVVSGSYTLISQTIDQLSARQTIEVGDHDVNDVALVLHPQLEISGSIRLEGNPPPSEHRGRMRVSLIASETGGPGQAAVNPDGSFSLKVTPAVYQIYVSCDASAYVKSIHFGDQDLTSGRIDLTQQSAGILNIVCGSEVGQIQGAVQTENGEPAAQAVITVGPEGEQAGLLGFNMMLMSDQNGHFDYRDFAPGNYKIFAWEGNGGDPQMLQSAEFRKAFESRAASVILAPGGSASVQLKLIPAADIEAEKNKLQ
jgi:hypothetical protein